MVPETEPFATDINWRLIPRLADILPSPVVAAKPKFFLDEPDPDQGGKPRLDIKIDMNDWTWVRYHPMADPITSGEYLPTDAMQQRYNRARKIRFYRC